GDGARRAPGAGGRPGDGLPRLRRRRPDPRRPGALADPRRDEQAQDVQGPERARPRDRRLGADRGRSRADAVSTIAAAATVVLLRDGRPSPEVFFVKRHGASAFMANAWVFPGGRLDALDRAPRVLDRVRGLDVASLLRRMHGVDDPELAIALVVC